MKKTFKVREYRRKMDKDELQEHLKLKRGNGAHENKKRKAQLKGWA